MRRFTTKEQRAYEYSNSVDSFEVPLCLPMVKCTHEVERGLAAEDQKHVQASCQALLDLFCDSAGIPYARLSVKDTASAKFSRGRSGRRRAVWKLYGTCDDDGGITLAFRTAVRRKVFAFRTFFQTLVHEFGHHFDYHRLKLAVSFHTRGFHLRVDSLYRPLLMALRQGPIDE